MKKSVFKRTLYLLLAMAMWIGMAVPAAAAEVSVNVGGYPVQWTDAKPFIDSNNRTLVPLRAVGEALMLTVDWDNTAREAVFSNGESTLYFPIGSSTARTGDGGTVTMDTAAVIVNDRTYAPIRYLAEYFGFSVDWDNANQTVVIETGVAIEPDPEPETDGDPDVVEPSGLTFADFGYTEFTFASGAGGWSTNLVIAADGSFEGSYGDSDMGDSGEGYPYGTYYYCDFKGQFEAPVKINDYTYSMKIKSLERKDTATEPWIDEGIRYIPSGPYGLEETDEMLVFLPFTEVSKLPEAFVEWVSMPLAVDFKEVGSIDFYGLYNPVREEGFFSAAG